MRVGSPSRAATLIELAVYSSLLLVLLAGTYTVVEGGARYLRLAEAGETASQQAIQAISKVSFELEQASQISLEVDSAPQEHLTFMSPLPVDGVAPGPPFDAGGTNMHYRKWVSVFQDANQLVKVENGFPSPGVVDPAAQPIPDFTAQVLTWPRRRPLANHILSVTFTEPSPAVVRIDLTTSVITGTNKATEIQLASSVRLLNQ